MTQYASQRLAKPLILLAVLLFGVQLVVGLLQAWYSVDPLYLQGIVNFNVLRAYHLNSLLLWVVVATVAGIIYLVPVLAKNELPRFAKIVPGYMWAVSLGILASLPLFQTGYNIWAFDQPWLVEGREWVEAGRFWDILLFAGIAITAAAVLVALPPRKQWNVPIWTLAVGLVAFALLYIPGNLFFPDLTTSEYFRWWTIHFWVELVLEAAYIAVIGLILILVVPDPRVKGIVVKYVFYDVVLATTAGLIGQGHHYFWIGTPTFWILLGGVISVLEIVPLTLMILDVFKIAPRIPLRNKPWFYYFAGIVTLGFIGPAMYGLTQTWPWTNWWEHGTWVTAAHAHLGMLAFGFGAISLIFFMTPDLGGRSMDRVFVTYGKWSFWFMLAGMVIQALIFASSGTIQIFYYRIVNAGWYDVFAARAQTGSFLMLSGSLIFVGYLTYAGVVLRHLYVPARSRASPGTVESAPPSGSTTESPVAASVVKPSYLRSLEGLPMLVVVALIFSAITTTALWSFGSTSVLNTQDPTLPYTLALVGYLGMAVVTMLIAIKLIRGVEFENERARLRPATGQAGGIAKTELLG